MGTIIKVYTAIFLVLMTVFISVGILSVQVDVQNARDYHAAVVNEIENSNHNSSVINACIEEAEDNGYILTVDSYKNSTGNYEFTVSKVVLKYKYSLSFLNISSDKEILGYAR